MGWRFSRRLRGGAGGNVGKAKSAQRCKVAPWLSARGDCAEGRFIQVGNSFLLSPAVQELPASATVVYFAMALEAAGRREFVFPAGAMKKFGIPPQTGRRAIKTLRERGFIDVRSGKNTREANVYAFTFDWKNL